MSKISINFEELQTIADTIDKEMNNLRQLFTEQDKYFNLLSDDSIWCGRVKDSCINKYKKLSKQYDDIIMSLSKYKQFISDEKEKYGVLDDNLSKEVDKIKNVSYKQDISSESDFIK